MAGLQSNKGANADVCETKKELLVSSDTPDLLRPLVGGGLSPIGFLQLLVALVAVTVLSRHNPDFPFLYVWLCSTPGKAMIIAMLFWLAPLQDIAFMIDRICALRAQAPNLAPFIFDPLLMKISPAMLPHVPKILANIEQIGPFMRHVMVPGVKEHMLPVMPLMMNDLEAMLPNLDLMAPVLPDIAPYIDDILPYLKDMLPYTAQLLPIVKVDRWWLVNPHLNKVVPYLDKIAPHAEVIVQAMPEMLPQIDILVKHIDNMMEHFDETIGVMDKLLPLMPLMPIADKTGMLDQKLAFALLPTVMGYSPLSNQITGSVATTGAAAANAIFIRADLLRNALKNRYESYQVKNLTVAAIKDKTTEQDDVVKTLPVVASKSVNCSKILNISDPETVGSELLEEETKKLTKNRS